MSIVARIKAITKKRAVHQTLFVYFGSMINGASLLAFNIVLARSLSQELFGVFSLVVLVLLTVAEMSDFGLNAGLLRFAPFYLASGQEDKLKALVRTVWRWRTTLSLVLTVGCAALSYPIARYIFGQPDIAPYIAFVSLGIGGTILLGFVNTYLQAKQRFLYSAGVQSLKGLGRLVLAIGLWLAGVQNLYAYLAIYAFVPWALFLMNYYVFPKGFRQSRLDPGVQQKMHSQLARFSFWLTVSSFVAIVGSRIDQIMISHYLGLAEVAIFTAAWQFIQFFPIIYNSINSVLTPKISALRSKADVIALLKKTFRWMSVGTLLVGLLIYPSQYLILFFFGQSYAPSMPIYLVLAYGLLSNVFIIPFALTITIFNQTRLVAYSGIIQLVVSVIGNVVFIPLYGIMGAVYTFAVSTFVLAVWNIVMALFLLKHKDFSVE